MSGKTWASVVMGIIIIIADIAWLITPTSNNYQFASFTSSSSSAPWLELGIIILIACLIWLGIDFSYMREGMKTKTQEKMSPSTAKNP